MRCFSSVLRAVTSKRLVLYDLLYATRYTGTRNFNTYEWKRRKTSLYSSVYGLLANFSAHQTCNFNSLLTFTLCMVCG